MYGSPLGKGDHPELDTSPQLDIEGIKIYQSVNGAAQRVVSLGHLDVATGIITFSSFRSAPLPGRLDFIMQVYFAKMHHET